MPNKKHHIKLDQEERKLLTQLSKRNNATAIKAQRSKAMLAMDCGSFGPALPDQDAAKISGLPIPTLERLRKRVCEVGPLGTLERKPRETPPVPPKVTGEVEARMIQIACTDPPAGFAKWTMQMIAVRLVELEIVDSISDETVRITLKKRLKTMADAIMVYCRK